QFLRPGDRQALQTDGVQELEHGRVRPNAQREREHGHECEAGVLQELAKREAEVVHTRDFWVTIEEWAKHQIHPCKHQTANTNTRKSPKLKLQGADIAGAIGFWRL